MADEKEAESAVKYMEEQDDLHSEHSHTDHVNPEDHFDEPEKVAHLDKKEELCEKLEKPDEKREEPDEKVDKHDEIVEELDEKVQEPDEKVQEPDEKEVNVDDEVENSYGICMKRRNISELDESLDTKIEKLYEEMNDDPNNRKEETLDEKIDILEKIMNADQQKGNGEKENVDIPEEKKDSVENEPPGKKEDSDKEHVDIRREKIRERNIDGESNDEEYVEEYFDPKDFANLDNKAKLEAYDENPRVRLMRCHENADSLFSSASGFNNYRGILNLACILLVLSSARVALENIIKYGILIDPISWVRVFLHDPYSWPSFGLVLVSSVFILFAFYIEYKLAHGTMSERVASVLHCINLGIQITFPVVVILVRHPNPIFSSVALILYVAEFLKLISYKMTNKWCRQARDQKPQRMGRNKSISGDLSQFDLNGKPNSLVQYPQNIHLYDLMYFMVAPTLCYELNFPRSGRIRKRFLIRRVLEMLFLSGLMIALIQQWILPIVNNARVPFRDMKIPQMVERILKLALPNLIVWLLWFYWLFHSCFNIMAELLQFGDRVFYKDWWNAEDVSYFWKNWNIIVHKWALRHVYKPLLGRGYSKLTASISVFLLSAFFHEYLVSIPLGMFRLWAFLGMFMQIPLAVLTGKYINGVWGNVIVWGSLIIGQPIAILMYYVDYYLSLHPS